MAKISVPSENLKKLREEFGISTRQMAEDLKVTIATVQQLENGKLKISPEMACKLGKYYGPDAKYWSQMEAEYRLSIVAKDETVKAVVAEIKKAKKQAPKAEPKAKKAAPKEAAEEAPKKRRAKAAPKAEAVAEVKEEAPAPKKRGRKPAPKVEAAPEMAPAKKKPGRKPKAAVVPEEDISSLM
jgi:addiction module HigA family antidote